MAKKSDFLSWDDELDLDVLLGDYTDFDEEFGSDSDFEITRPVQKTDTPSALTYTCPICNKVLKTISGFRGHTSKQHGKHDLKASHHRTADSDTTTEPQTTRIDTSNKRCKLEEQSPLPSGLFHKAFTSAMISLGEDDLSVFLGGKDFIDLCKFTASHDTAEIFFNRIFTKIFEDSGRQLSCVLDREHLLRNLHSKRIDGNVREEYLNLYKDVTSNDSAVHSFVQLVFLEVLEKILAEQIVMHSATSTDEAGNITDNDQTVLMYVCGSIIRILKKKYTKVSGSELLVKVVLSFEDHKPTSGSSNFLTGYRSWIAKKDRGGLKYPSDTFFLLVRELEIVTRKQVPTNTLNAKALLKEPLKEAIMENFMVKLYTKKLFDGQSDNNLSATTTVLGRSWWTLSVGCLHALDKNWIYLLY